MLEHRSPLAAATVALIAVLWPSSWTIAEPLTPAQIRQIEGIAQQIAVQHNAANRQDDMTVSSRATATGRNVRIENVIRVRERLSSAEAKAFADATEREIVPLACSENRSNPAFDRGLSYTFRYLSPAGTRLAEFTVDKQRCAR